MQNISHDRENAIDTSQQSPDMPERQWSNDPMKKRPTPKGVFTLLHPVTGDGIDGAI